MTERWAVDGEFGDLLLEASPKPLTRIVLREDGLGALRQANQVLGLALSEDEIEYLHAAYRQMQRDPTDVELMMFAQANSEHCRHKIFNADWIVDGDHQDRSLFDMIRNTHKAINGRGVLSAYRDNAAVIEGTTEDRLFIETGSGRYRFHHEPVHSWRN